MANTIKTKAIAKIVAPMPYIAVERSLANIPCTITPNKRPTPSFSATSAVLFFCPLSTKQAYQRTVRMRNLRTAKRSARHQEKILRGEKPVDLPIGRPTDSGFLIDLKTARQIGLTIPPNVGRGRRG